MNFRKHSFLWLILPAFAGIYALLGKVDLYKSRQQTEVVFRAEVLKDDEFRLYFTPKGVMDFSGHNQRINRVKGQPGMQDIVFELPPDKDISQLRIDIGFNNDPRQSKITLEKILFRKGALTKEVPLSELQPNVWCRVEGNDILLFSVNNTFDPFLVFDENAMKKFGKVYDSVAYRFWFALLFTAMFAGVMLVSDNKTQAALCASIAFCVFLLTFLLSQYIPLRHETVVTVDLQMKHKDEIYLFYVPHGAPGFTGTYMEKQEITGSDNLQRVRFAFPDSLDFNILRVDFGDNKENDDARLTKLQITGKRSLTLNEREITQVFDRYQTTYDSAAGIYHLTGDDPFLATTDVWVLGSSYRDSSYTLLRLAFALFFAISIYGLLLKATRRREEQHFYYYRAQIAVFVVVLILPVLDTIFDFKLITDSTENRIVSKKPELKSNNIIEYPKLYESYYNENFGLRNLLIRWGGHLKTSLFTTSANPDEVMIGKKKWMYFRGEGDNNVKDIRRENLLTQPQLEELAVRWHQRRLDLEARGMNYYLAYWPEKHSIYPQYLPDGAEVKDPSVPARFEQITRYCLEHEPSVRIVDSRKKLRDASEHVQVYLKNDTHWNEYGAFLSYQTLMQRIGEDVPDVLPVLEEKDFDIQWTDKPIGDLLGMMGMRKNRSFYESIPEFNLKNGPDSIEVVDALEYGHDAIRHRNLSCKNNLKAVVFRDSYSRAMIKFIDHNFSEVLYLWTIFDQGNVDKFGPNVVVEAYVERSHFFGMPERKRIFPKPE
ncbi:hypothetical protein WBG78_20555 [Chryseolinea sp. T2]|uniref:alginate O-acetyltransferase AlgX-related protein n=1 Tax=Chryseolinea sp. T2 TaxID=3129255 RepID=UPI003076998C